MIDKFTIEKIKSSANIVDVIQDFRTLKRESGSTYTCLCPFHDDRHLGSFKVSERKNYYRCFSCGAHGGPVDFLIYHQNMKYIEALKWLSVKYGISCEELDKTKVPPTICKAHTPPPPLPMLTLPEDMVNKLKIGDSQEDNFCNWLRALPWPAEQRPRVDKTLHNYMVGHGKDGHTVFWQVDEQGNVRTGKMMLYKTDGHRDKDTHGNFDYVHSRLKKVNYWDDEKQEVNTCYFGQHLLDFFPDATVNIVESEKTALICSIAYGDNRKHLWMASGGKSGLNRAKLEPFIKRGRFIVLYPDKDGAKDWSEIAKTIGYDKLAVNTAMMEQNWKPQDGPKADFADIVSRMLYERLETKTNDVIKQFEKINPAFKLLEEKFNLVPTY